MKDVTRERELTMPKRNFPNFLDVRACPWSVATINRSIHDCVEESFGKFDDELTYFYSGPNTKHFLLPRPEVSRSNVNYLSNQMRCGRRASGQRL
ncbi:hypothetical protein CA85_22990 [Allorhodopirellula solitaria]|uniref:Uncharacterized protein n=1 Tax=Allorhodopirellula solitaria TaxID=2527987 RepID=A0A5C5XXN4_9BACT|nr:hypothetical protein CA85_22990 [Allorhodopirellula solitaria]